MTNLEMRLSGVPADLSEGEKNAVLHMAELIKRERGMVDVNNDNQENYV